MGDPDVICTKCRWSGLTAELDMVKCPKCGDAMGIEDYHKSSEPIWVYFGGSFNWNKK